MLSLSLYFVTFVYYLEIKTCQKGTNIHFNIWFECKIQWWFPWVFNCSSLSFFAWEGKVLVAQLCPTVLEPAMLLCPWNSPGKLLEWVAILFSRESSWPRDKAPVSHTAGRFFTVWAAGEALRGKGPRKKWFFIWKLTCLWNKFSLHYLCFS